MEQFDLKQAWQEALNAKQSAYAENERFELQRQILKRRIQGCTVIAKRIIAKTGNVQPVGKWEDGPFEIQESDFVPLGRLAEKPDQRGRTHGFASVVISPQVSITYITDKKSMFRSELRTVRTVSDEVDSMVIKFFAAAEDGSNRELFAHSRWSITDGFNNPDQVDRLSDALEFVATAADVDVQVPYFRMNPTS